MRNKDKFVKDNLNARKEKILKVVVEEYINSAAPVSSLELRDRYFTDLSSATIRNELAALEQMGYLRQPHASSGRVPTIDAYRLYVNKLMPRRKLNASELKLIKEQFNLQMLQIKDLLKKTAKVISEVTNYTSLAYMEDISGAVIQKIRIVKLNSQSALVIVVTDYGVLKDATVTLTEDLDDEFFDSLSMFINAAYSGRRIAEVVSSDAIIKSVSKQYRKFFNAVLDIIKNYYVQTDPEDFVLEGASKILSYPEYSNINKAKAMIAVLESKEELLPMLKQKDDIKININIDHADGEGSLADCAVITVGYSVGGRITGQAGVIGPVRMDYSKVVSVLDYIGKTLAQLPISGGKVDIEEGPSLKNITVMASADDKTKK